MNTPSNQRILIFTDWFLPGFKAGGPIRSIANLVERIPVEFDIVTSVFDHQSTDPYPGIEADSWVQFSDRVRVYYCSREGANEKAMERIIRGEEYHRIYFNSLFSFTFTLSPMRICRSLGLAKKIVLAPRGMLKPSALAEKSGKKKIFLYMSRWMGLFNEITWHATNETEEVEIKRHYGKKCLVRIAPNLSSIHSSVSVEKKKEIGKVKLLSIARISPEKGIWEALLFLKETDPSLFFEVDFYGVQQNEVFFKNCQELASTIANATISWNGEVQPERIPHLLREAHFLFAPTRGENFGHAIAEALLHSTPVIVSDQTPWQDLTEKGAGWVLPLKKDVFAPVLNQCAQMGQSEYDTMIQKAGWRGKEIAENESAIADNLTLFQLNKQA